MNSKPTLNIATDGSKTGRGRDSSGTASFVALEDKMAFYDPHVDMPYFDRYTEDHSFIPEFTACVQAVKYAQMRMAEGVYDNVNIYTDNKAALSITEYMIQNGPVNMHDEAKLRSDMLLDDKIYESCVEYTGGETKNMATSPLRFVFTNLAPGVKRKFNDLNNLSAILHQLGGHDKFTFEHVKAHQEHRLDYMNSHDAMKTRLNSLADYVATTVNEADFDPKNQRDVVDEINHRVDVIEFERDMDTQAPWVNDIDANMMRTSLAKHKLEAESNGIFIDDHIDELKQQGQWPAGKVAGVKQTEVKPQAPAQAPIKPKQKSRNNDYEIDF